MCYVSHAPRQRIQYLRTPSPLRIPRAPRRPTPSAPRWLPPDIRAARLPSAWRSLPGDQSRIAFEQFFRSSQTIGTPPTSGAANRGMSLAGAGKCSANFRRMVIASRVNPAICVSLVGTKPGFGEATITSTYLTSSCSSQRCNTCEPDHTVLSLE